MDLSSGCSLWLCFSVGVELMSFGVKKVVTIESSNLGRYLGRNGLFSGNFWPLYNLYNLTSSQSILDNKPETKRQRSIYVTLSDSDNVFNLNFQDNPTNPHSESCVPHRVDSPGTLQTRSRKKTLQTLFLQNQTESLVSPVVNQQIANPYLIYFFSPCFPTIILVTIFNQWRCKISFYSIVFLQHQCWSSLVAIGQSRYYQSTFTSHTLSWHSWHQPHLAATFSNLLIFSAISR